MPSPPASCPNAADAARACTQSCAAGHRNDLPWRVHGPPAPQEQPAQPAASCCGPLAPWTARPPAHPPARRPPACPPTLPTGTLCRGWRDRANGTVPPVFWSGPVHINDSNFGAVPYMLIWTSFTLLAVGQQKSTLYPLLPTLMSAGIGGGGRSVGQAPHSAVCGSTAPACALPGRLRCEGIHRPIQEALPPCTEGRSLQGRCGRRLAAWSLASSRASLLLDL